MLVLTSWMAQRDLREVLQIENGSFEFPWSELDFTTCLKERNCMGMVSCHNNIIIGYMIYTMNNTFISLVNLAIHPDYRRMKIGSEMIIKLTNKLSQRRKRVSLSIRESNLSGQLFFRRNGFLATSILNHYYTETEEDAYSMQYFYQLPSLVENCN